jgi:DNA-binding response OmpR family regulator
MKKILLAEDDADFAQVLKHYLELFDFEVHWASDGAEAFSAFQNEVFQFCILDVMMPKMDGFTLAEKMVNYNPEVPFLFLTAKKLKEDKIRGLKLGADDYIVKPFEADELVLRIQNILKRSEKTTVTRTESSDIQIGKFVFDTKRLQLKGENSLQQLTEKEAALLLFLFENKNQLLKREVILKAIWDTDDFFSGRSMDVFISRLRKYFKEDENIAIESKRNLGLEFRILNYEI